MRMTTAGNTEFNVEAVTRSLLYPDLQMNEHVSSLTTALMGVYMVS